MSRTSKAYEELSAATAKSGISPELKNAPIVAILHGPKEAIECIVQKASRDSKIPMDWGYVGGRAMIHTNGDRAAAHVIDRRGQRKIVNFRNPKRAPFSRWREVDFITPHALNARAQP